MDQGGVELVFIYIVLDIGSDELPQIEACFSTKQKAEDYKKSLDHTWPNEYRIDEYKLDPDKEV